MPESLLRVIPKIRPRLDPDFRPAALGNRNFVQAAHASGRAAPLLLALEHAGVVTRYDTACFPAGHANEGQNFDYAERILKFLLWQRGGSRLRLCGPPGLAKSIRQCYAPGASRSFDAGFFSGIYGSKSFQVAASTKAAMPRAKGGARPMGRHLEGCRIGFDAGASSRKVAALIDGKEVFSVGTAWEPKLHSIWRYHFDGFNDSIARAARHLPRIDAIGVSSAGICVGKQIKVSSLFRKVQAEHPRDFKGAYPGHLSRSGKKMGQSGPRTGQRRRRGRPGRRHEPRPKFSAGPFPGQLLGGGLRRFPGPASRAGSTSSPSPRWTIPGPRPVTRIGPGTRGLGPTTFPRMPSYGSPRAWASASRPTTGRAPG